MEFFVKSKVVVNKELAWKKLVYRAAVLKQVIAYYFRLRRYFKFAVLIVEIHEFAVPDMGDYAGVYDCILIGLLVEKFLQILLVDPVIRIYKCNIIPYSFINTPVACR